MIPGLFPEKTAATIFSLKIEFKEKTKVFCRAEGVKMQLVVLILKSRLRRNL